MASATRAPKARTDDILIREFAGGETVVYDRISDEAHDLNRVASAVWRRCDGEATVAEVAASLSIELGMPCTEDIVLLSLDELCKVNLVEADGWSPPGISRRDVMRRVGPGVAAAALLPAVLSVIAPTPAAAATCQQSGEACTSNAQCCSGLCLSGGTCA